MPAKGCVPARQLAQSLGGGVGCCSPRGLGSTRRARGAGAAGPRAAERAVNQLARTFATRKALKRYRTGGTQKVTVEHVTVNAGGQAIVGNVAHGGGGTDEDGR